MVKIEVQTQHVNVLRALHGFGEEDYSSGRTLPAGLSNRNGGLCAKNIRKSQQNSRRTAEGLNCQVFWGQKGEVWQIPWIARDCDFRLACSSLGDPLPFPSIGSL